MSFPGRQDAMDIVRKELRGFVATAEHAGIDRERMRRLTRLSSDDWQRWLGFLQDDPLPAGPALPLVLRHLGYLNARLSHPKAARGG
jgi:hypothetical protein